MSSLVAADIPAMSYHLQNILLQNHRVSLFSGHSETPVEVSGYVQFCPVGKHAACYRVFLNVIFLCMPFLSFVFYFSSVLATQGALHLGVLQISIYIYKHRQLINVYLTA
jgi:hypothetical protein